MKYIELTDYSSFVIMACYQNYGSSSTKYIMIVTKKSVKGIFESITTCVSVERPNYNFKIDFKS